MVITNRRAGWREILQDATSLRCKTTVCAVVLTLAVTAAVSGFLLRSSVKAARDIHDEQAMHLAVLLSEAVAAPLEDDDQTALNTLLTNCTHNALAFAIVTDAEGHELASAERPELNLLAGLRARRDRRPVLHATPILYSGTADTPAFLHVTYPVRRRGAAEWPPDDAKSHLMGYVQTGMVVDHWQRSVGFALDLVTGVGMLASLIAIPFGFYLVRRVLSPLDTLADSMHEFSRGRLDIRSNVDRHDEIGRLATAFNCMADQHQQTHERILKLNTELEIRVDERTRQLRELASREPVTGLFNRRYFNEVFERGVSEALRYDGDVSCLMLDLDDFKKVNDVHGHQAGDELLMIVARTIQKELRSADVPARYGGDEFVVLLPQTDSEQARTLAGRIADAYARATQEPFPTSPVSMSIGIASLKGCRLVGADALLRAADRAMYQAKSEGKNRIVVADQADLAPEKPATTHHTRG